MAKKKELNDTPLLVAAAEATAVRVAKIRSLTLDVTGLSVRKHKKMCEFLEILASESFSDGTLTMARVNVLAMRMGRSRAQIYRYCNDAETLGILTTDRRKGSIGQDISSERKIVWDAVDTLLKIERAKPPVSAGPSNETPPSQMRRGCLNCDTPVSIETPNSTDSTDRTDKKLRSEASDQKFRTSTATRGRSLDRKAMPIDRDEIVQLAETLFRKMRYSGDEGFSIWKAAGAVKLGLLPETVVVSVANIAGTRAGGPAGPGFFREVLAEKLGMSMQELSKCFGRVFIRQGVPGKAPPPPKRTLDHPNRVFKPPPRCRSEAEIRAEMNAARNSIFNLIGSES